MEQKFTHITIDGVEHQIIRHGGGLIFVDSPNLRGHPCAQHRLSDDNLQLLSFGGTTIQTNGCVYSRVKISR